MQYPAPVRSISVRIFASLMAIAARTARPLAVRAISSCTVLFAAGRIPLGHDQRSIQCPKVLLEQCGPFAGG